MRPFFYVLFFIVITITCEAQKSFTNYHVNGNISEKGYLIKGKIVGDYTSYHINGNTKVEAKYVEGFMIEKKEFNDSGSLIKSAYMINGSDKFQIINYSPMGQIISKGFLDNNGLKTGEWQVLSVRDNTYSTYVYKDGLIINLP